MPAGAPVLASSSEEKFSISGKISIAGSKEASGAQPYELGSPRGLVAMTNAGFRVPPSVTLAHQLGLRKAGKRFIGACPACGYKDAFAVCDGCHHPLVYCHACQDTDAVILAIRRRGLWLYGTHTIQSNPVQTPPRELSRAGLRARELWIKAGTASGTLVEIYLRSRGIVMPIPPTLRFLPLTKHSLSDQVLPAMIAAVTIWPDRRPCAVHRTFLAPDGSGKAAVATPRMTLGPCRRGAVRLAEATDQLMVGEGIETCLAAMQATGKPAWAALSTAGLRNLEIPEQIKEIVVLADADLPGEEAAQYAAHRWVREGRRVRIARPPKGQDFNDLLLDGNHFTEERAI
jgi:putative DNA primase/helicase